MSKTLKQRIRYEKRNNTLVSKEIYAKSGARYVVVIDPGDLDERSLAFWSKLAQEGLIDEMVDGDGNTIYKQGQWLASTE